MANLSMDDFLGDEEELPSRRGGRPQRGGSLEDDALSLEGLMGNSQQASEPQELSLEIPEIMEIKHLKAGDYSSVLKRPVDLPEVEAQGPTPPAPVEATPPKPGHVPQYEPQDDAITPLDTPEDTSREDEDSLEDPLADDDMYGLEGLLGDAGDDGTAHPMASFMTDDPESSLLDDLEGDEDEEDLFGGFNLDAVITQAIDMGASDIHITPDKHVAFSILGEVHYMKDIARPSGSITQRLAQSIVTNVVFSDYNKDWELDSSYVVHQGKYAGRRLRLSVGKTFGDEFLVMRVIADEVPTPEDLGVAGDLLSWVQLPNGLVMVNGPTGTGKSTTIASMLRRIQKTRSQKIITLERPVEFVFPDDGPALIHQREIGRDSRSFASGLDGAMRQAPDIILVGEVRNRIEVDALLRAAETGHLAISTMHTVSPASTINRIMSLYEGDDQRRVLASLADVARGFANQVLVKTPDGRGRVAVREVMPVDRTVSHLIEEGNVRGIQEYQWKQGRTMEQQLALTVKKGATKLETARAQAANPLFFDQALQALRGR